MEEPAVSFWAGRQGKSCYCRPRRGGRPLPTRPEIGRQGPTPGGAAGRSAPSLAASQSSLVLSGPASSCSDRHQ